MWSWNSEALQFGKHLTRSNAISEMALGRQVACTSMCRFSSSPMEPIPSITPMPPETATSRRWANLQNRNRRKPATALNLLLLSGQTATIRWLMTWLIYKNLPCQAHHPECADQVLCVHNRRNSEDHATLSDCSYRAYSESHRNLHQLQKDRDDWRRWL